jgi:hypothetical protein
MSKKLTTEEFIEKATKIHGNIYDYSLADYIGSKQKITVICKIHNKFNLSPNSHLKGNGCKACGVEVRASKQRGDKELFLKKAREKHGDRYDYSKVEYFNSLTEVEILCPTHGAFLQTPKIHYVANCPKCGREAQTEKAKKGKGQFVKEMQEIYGDRYDLSLVEYINGRTPVSIICKDRGILKVTPASLLNKKVYLVKGKKKTRSTDKEMFLEEVFKLYGGKNNYDDTIVGNSRGKIDVVCENHGKFTVEMASYFNGVDCPKCSAINYKKTRSKTTEEFVEQAKKVHGDKCDYTNTIYKSCKEKVEIKCNMHNIYFEQYPTNHLFGGCCRKCLSENISKSLQGKEGTCGYTKSRYIKQAGDRKAYVYLIKCWNENEEFYKIGKTFLDINIRFKKSNLCYEFKEVHFHYGDAGYIYDLENELHRIYKPHRHKPKKWFAGHTECFTTELPTQEIIDLGNERIY